MFDPMKTRWRLEAAKERDAEVAREAAAAVLTKLRRDRLAMSEAIVADVARGALLELDCMTAFTVSTVSRLALHRSIFSVPELEIC
jgi:hypothetical protein